MTCRLSSPARLSSGRPSTADPDRNDGFDDRYVQALTTFGGAGHAARQPQARVRAAVRAVLGGAGLEGRPEDTRAEGQRFHDALQHACELLRAS